MVYVNKHKYKIYIKRSLNNSTRGVYCIDRWKEQCGNPWLSFSWLHVFLFPSYNNLCLKNILPCVVIGFFDLPGNWTNYHAYFYNGIKIYLYKNSFFSQYYLVISELLIGMNIGYLLDFLLGYKMKRITFCRWTYYRESAGISK